jgi:hypothetical protein
MATDLQDMRAKLTDWSNRNGLSDSLLNDFINTAIRRAEQHPRHSFDYMMIELTGNLVDGTSKYAYPVRFKELEAVYIAEIDSKELHELEVMSLKSGLRDFPFDNGTENKDRPLGITLDPANRQFIYRATPDNAYDFRLYYYETTAALAADADTHWLITNAEELIRYGAMRELELWRHDDTRAQTWNALFKESLKRLQDTEIGAKHKGSYPKVSSLYVV